ncbi:MAG: hypothetical protein LBG99_07215 [Propionibacteriaceae bacterium]|jgi:hypothetical protein|nr:hypothetical protein [Propionibacteriaceae bacterium]
MGQWSSWSRLLLWGLTYGGLETISFGVVVTPEGKNRKSKKKKNKNKTSENGVAVPNGQALVRMFGDKHVNKSFVRRLVKAFETEPHILVMLIFGGALVFSIYRGEMISMIAMGVFLVATQLVTKLFDKDHKVQKDLKKLTEY